jgi:hypothetical protein
MIYFEEFIFSLPKPYHICPFSSLTVVSYNSFCETIYKTHLLLITEKLVLPFFNKRATAEFGK